MKWMPSLRRQRFSLVTLTKLSCAAAFISSSSRFGPRSRHRVHDGLFRSDTCGQSLRRSDEAHLTYETLHRIQHRESFRLLSSPASDPGDGPARLLDKLGKSISKVAVGAALTFGLLTAIPTASYAEASGNTANVALCLFKSCQVELAKCVANPKCLANVICINTCVGRPDEGGCQVECGNLWENDVVGEFNKCAVSDKDCVPQRQDDGSYPVPAKSKTVSKFDTGLFNGRWYITAGQNELFDTFDCQVHFFTETAPGKFFGKLNWRIDEPDGEFFTRDALQRFVQDPEWPAHLVNHDNEYLHYQDDWYVLDYAADDNPEGTPPFSLIYYRGSNDAWDGYGGAVVYTRDAKLPESIVPRLREAAKKVNFDFDKDFKRVDNTCTVQTAGEKIQLREKFAGKVAIQTEKQLQREAVVARNAANNGVKAQKLFFSNELGQVEKAFDTLKDSAQVFEEELAKDATKVEQGVVNEVKELERDVVGVVEKN